MAKGISSEQINVTIKAVDESTKVFNDLTKNAEKVSGEISKEFRKLTSDLETQFGGITRLIARVFSVRAIFRFGKGLLEMGGRAVETANLFAVSFGNMTGEMDAFGRKLQEVSGISDILFRDQSARINNLFSTLGVAAEGSLVMTQDLMSRGLDLSSLFNVDRDKMFDQIRSGMVGMIKPLRPYGINLEVANVNQRAWAEGIAETGQELTQAQKALTRYLIIMDSTTKAQGDMERTIDTVANAQRRLSDMWVQFQSVGGQLVIPMISAILKLLIPTVTVLTKVANSVVNLNRWLTKQVELYPVLGVVTAILSTMAKMIGLVTVAVIIKIAVMIVWSKALAGVAVQIARIIKLLAIKFWAVTLVVGVIIVLVTLLKRWAGDQTKAGNTLATSGSQASDFADALGDVGKGLDDVRKKQRFLTPLDEITNIPDASGGTLGGGIDLDIPDMDALLAGLSDLTDALLTGDGILDSIKQAFSDSWELTKLIWNEASKWISELRETSKIVDGIFNTFEFIGGVISNIILFIEGVTSGLISAYNWAEDLRQKLLNLVPKPMQGIFDWLTNPISAALKEAEKLFDLLDKATGKGGTDKPTPAQKTTKNVISGMSLVSPVFGMQKTVFDTVRKIFGGGRADGGAVTPDKFNVVGERGPEFFIPDTRGTVVSNETIRATQGGGGMDTGAIAQAIQSLADRPSKLYIDGREFASVTYSSYEEAGSRSGRQALVRSVG